MVLYSLLTPFAGRYGVVLDAGSSGTRVHVYRWLENSIALHQASGDKDALKSLPEIKTKEEWTKKIHPGISSFADRPEQVGPDHLAELLKHARQIVPDDVVQRTPVFLLATAGMRLLDEPRQRVLLNQICAYFRANSDFTLPDCDAHIQVIGGDTEGLYGWIATNYLMDSFDNPEGHAHGKGHHTYGFLDMGGASTQIAFEPNATEATRHADDLKLLRLRNIDGSLQEHRVFVTSWLEFGVREARRRFIHALQTSIGGDPTSHVIKELPDPCLPSGLMTTVDGKGVSPNNNDKPTGPYLLGTGKFDECLRQTYTLLDKDAPCPKQPCLLHGVHVPAIDFDVNHFIGISEFWHTTHEIFDMGHKDNSAYDFHTYQHRVEVFCSQDWATIADDLLRQKWGKKVSRESAYEVCFKASWIINMLHNGIGVPRVGLEESSGIHDNSNGTTNSRKLTSTGKSYLDAFQAVNKIHSTEVSWTLGKMVLYASSQVPPRNNDSTLLPVGFGSNVPGIPADFQHPSVELVPDSSSQVDQWQDALFHNHHSSRRVPGFFFFLLILALVGFFMCGRSRRLRMYHRFHSFTRRILPRFYGGGGGGGGGDQYYPGRYYPKKKKPFFGGILGGDIEPSYEQVLEDGNNSPRGGRNNNNGPNEFELAPTTMVASAGSSVIDSDGGAESPPSSDSYFRRQLRRQPSYSSSHQPVKENHPHHHQRSSVSSSSNNNSSNNNAGGGGGGLGIINDDDDMGVATMDRKGLVVRTESRDRLVPVQLQQLLTNGGRRSRATSPSRLKSPLSPMSPE